MALLLNAGDTVSRSYSYTQPSPLHPSQPQGTGERTGNLLYIEPKTVDVRGVTVTMYSNRITLHGTASTSGGRNTKLVDNFVLPSGTYYAKMYGNSSNAIFFLNKASDGSVLASLFDNIITIEQDTEVHMGVNVIAGTVYNETSITIMLNLGSTALPYEPYGYKIPILSANTTTPVYLGEVQTTRKVKKLVLTGEESWNTYRSNYYITVSDYYRMYDIGSHLSVCSHYPGIQVITIPEMHYGLGGLVDGSTHTAWNGNIVFNPSPMISSLTDWKAFLVQQYAAGTPVTVWYVQNAPTTSIVNEPIRKIGTYADTVSGITIPTTTGANSFDVLTTLKPSEVTANYHGWHTGAVHERENGAWT